MVAVVNPVEVLDPRVLEREGRLLAEQLIAQSGVEGLDVTVLPGGHPRDEGAVDIKKGEPAGHLLDRELRAIVRAHDSGREVAQEQLREMVDRGFGQDRLCDQRPHREVRVFVDQAEHPQASFIGSQVFTKS